MSERSTNVDLRTDFLPASRATTAQVEADRKLLAANRILVAILDAADIMVMVLNHERQVLVANSTLLQMADGDCLFGSRPGEVIHCIHADDGSGGCGTSTTCRSCGAALAIELSQLEDKPVIKECLLSARRGGRVVSVEYQVKCMPVEVEGIKLSVLSFRDISHEKRRAALEQVFFHDVLNTITGLHGYASILSTMEISVEERERLTRRMGFLVQRIRREVEDQRTLVSAEAGDLTLSLEEAWPGAILDSVERIFAGQLLESRIRLQREERGPTRALRTDSSLLLRVLTNMMKNALEATPSGGVIRLWSEAGEKTCSFSVWNEGHIPDLVSRQVFKRSFSTKASSGRGLGTYSMRLFGERFLGGRVSFHSSEEEGTTFVITLPIELEPRTE